MYMKNEKKTFIAIPKKVEADINSISQWILESGLVVYEGKAEEYLNPLLIIGNFNTNRQAFFFTKLFQNGAESARFLLSKLDEEDQENDDDDSESNKQGIEDVMTEKNETQHSRVKGDAVMITNEEYPEGKEFVVKKISVKKGSITFEPQDDSPDITRKLDDLMNGNLGEGESIERLK